MAAEDNKKIDAEDVNKAHLRLLDLNEGEIDPATLEAAGVIGDQTADSMREALERIEEAEVGTDAQRTAALRKLLLAGGLGEVALSDAEKAILNEVLQAPVGDEGIASRSALASVVNRLNLMEAGGRGTELAEQEIVDLTAEREQADEAMFQAQERRDNASEQLALMGELDVMTGFLNDRNHVISRLGELNISVDASQMLQRATLEGPLGAEYNRRLTVLQDRMVTAANALNAMGLRISSEHPEIADHVHGLAIGFQEYVNDPLNHRFADYADEVAYVLGAIDDLWPDRKKLVAGDDFKAVRAALTYFRMPTVGENIRAEFVSGQRVETARRATHSALRGGWNGISWGHGIRQGLENEFPSEGYLAEIEVLEELNAIRRFADNQEQMILDAFATIDGLNNPSDLDRIFDAGLIDEVNNFIPGFASECGNLRGAIEAFNPNDLAENWEFLVNNLAPSLLTIRQQLAAARDQASEENSELAARIQEIDIRLGVLGDYEGADFDRAELVDRVFPTGEALDDLQDEVDRREKEYKDRKETADYFRRGEELAEMDNQREALIDLVEHLGIDGRLDLRTERDRLDEEIKEARGKLDRVRRYGPQDDIDTDEAKRVIADNQITLRQIQNLERECKKLHGQLKGLTGHLRLARESGLDLYDPNGRLDIIHDELDRFDPSYNGFVPQHLLDLSEELQVMIDAFNARGRAGNLSDACELYVNQRPGMTNADKDYLDLQEIAGFLDQYALESFVAGIPEYRSVLTHSDLASEPNFDLVASERATTAEHDQANDDLQEQEKRKSTAEKLKEDLEADLKEDREELYTLQHAHFTGVVEDYERMEKRLKRIEAEHSAKIANANKQIARLEGEIEKIYEEHGEKSQTFVRIPKDSDMKDLYLTEEEKAEKAKREKRIRQWQITLATYEQSMEQKYTVRMNKLQEERGEAVTEARDKLALLEANGEGNPLEIDLPDGTDGKNPAKVLQGDITKLGEEIEAAETEIVESTEEMGRLEEEIKKLEEVLNELAALRGAADDFEGKVGRVLVLLDLMRQHNIDSGIDTNELDRMIASFDAVIADDTNLPFVALEVAEEFSQLLQVEHFRTEMASVKDKANEAFEQARDRLERVEENKDLTDEQAAMKLMVAMLEEQYPEMSERRRTILARQILAEDTFAHMEAEENLAILSKKPKAMAIVKDGELTEKYLSMELKLRGHDGKTFKPFAGLKPKDLSPERLEELFAEDTLDITNGFFMLALIKDVYGVEDERYRTVKDLLMPLLITNLGAKKHMHIGEVAERVKQAFDEELEFAGKHLNSWTEHVDESRPKILSAKKKWYEDQLKSISHQLRQGKIDGDTFEEEQDRILAEAEELGIDLGDASMSRIWNSSAMEKMRQKSALALGNGFRRLANTIVGTTFKSLLTAGAGAATLTGRALVGTVKMPFRLLDVGVQLPFSVAGFLVNRLTPFSVRTRSFFGVAGNHLGTMRKGSWEALKEVVPGSPTDVIGQEWKASAQKIRTPEQVKPKVDLEKLEAQIKKAEEKTKMGAYEAPGTVTSIDKHPKFKRAKADITEAVEEHRGKKAA